MQSDRYSCGFSFLSTFKYLIEKLNEKQKTATTTEVVNAVF
jgi:hypothetical protein